MPVCVCARAHTHTHTQVAQAQNDDQRSIESSSFQTVWTESGVRNKAMKGICKLKAPLHRGRCLLSLFNLYGHEMTLPLSPPIPLESMENVIF